MRALTKGMEKKASANPGQRRPSSAVTRAEHPDAGDVDGVDEGEGDGAGLGVGVAHVPAHLAAEGVGRAQQVDAVLLELVDQVGQHAQPGEPHEVAPARHREVAAQRVGAEQQGQEQGRAEAHVGPHIGKGEHRWRLALPDQIFIRDAAALSDRLARFLHEVAALGESRSAAGSCWISACRARITGGPEHGILHADRHQALARASARARSRAPAATTPRRSASGRSGTRSGKRRTPALYEASGKGAA